MNLCLALLILACGCNLKSGVDLCRRLGLAVIAIWGSHLIPLQVLLLMFSSSLYNRPSETRRESGKYLSWELICQIQPATNA